MKPTKTGILVFTRSYGEEARVKTFLSKISTSNNQLIAKSLIHQTITKVKKTKLPYLVYSNQVGNTFGERLANAVEDCLEHHFDNIIIIGNDCPTLTSEQIIKSQELLHNYDVVLGPEKDGGTYLIGINKQNFNKKEFQQLAWQTSKLQQSWTSYLEKNKLSDFQLIEQIDVDDRFSFIGVIKQLSHNHLLYSILYLIFSQFLLKKVKNQFYNINYYIAQNQTLRAPPFISFNY